MGERCVLASLPDILQAQIVGGSGNPDITFSPTPDTKGAISVKTSYKTHFKERETHPEYEAFPDNAYCILLMPRLLELRLFRLHSSPQTINHRDQAGVGRLATTPEGIVPLLKEMIGE